MKTALLIIDVQIALFNPLPQPYQWQQVLNRINSVVKLCRDKTIPLFFIQHEKPESSLAYGSDGWQLHPALQALPTDAYIRKTTPDAFEQTTLQTELSQTGISRLLVCGYATEFCIDTTVRRAAALGYTVDLISDAHTTHDAAHAPAHKIQQHHNATLPNITSFSGTIRALSSDALHLIL